VSRDSIPWLALGIDLRLTTTEEGGRRTPIGMDADYTRFAYRPNWGLPGMTGREQVGAPVVCFGKFPLHPGDRTRAAIVPLVDLSLDLWHALSVGDELRMFEGSRICGHASVGWITATIRPLPDEDEQRFCSWAQGGSPPS
jgi:hypothetical protein